MCPVVLLFLMCVTWSGDDRVSGNAEKFLTCLLQFLATVRKIINFLTTTEKMPESSKTSNSLKSHSGRSSLYQSDEFPEFIEELKCVWVRSALGRFQF